MATTSDIGFRTQAFVVKKLLDRAHPYMCLEKFGEAQTLPSNSSKTLSFRRYEALPKATTPLTEGVAPSGSSLTITNINVTLQQYGAHVPLTDVVLDTHEDPVLSELAEGVLPEQAAQTIESVRYGKLQACSNKFYAGGVVARNAVVLAFDLNMQRKIVRALKRQNASPITRVLSAGPNIATEPVAKAFIGLIHPDLEPTIRSLTGFVPVEKYAGITPYDGELGKVEDVRYIASTLNAPYPDAGGAKGTMISTSGTSADVYPIIFLGQRAYAISAFKGKYAADVMVANPRAIPGVDPLGQQGSVGWKTMQGAVILNDLFMAVGEVAAPAL